MFSSTSSAASSSTSASVELRQEATTPSSFSTAGNRRIHRSDRPHHHIRSNDGSSSQTHSSSAGSAEPVASGHSMTALQAIGKHSPIAPHTMSAQLASAVSTACFYPFDVIKTRFMSQDGTTTRQHNGMTYRSIRHSLRTIYVEEGLRTLFRGLPVALSGAMTAWGVYMCTYRTLCNWSETTSYLGRSGVSVLASISSTMVSCPIFLIKSRMQLEEARHGHGEYSTFRSGLRHMLQTGGVRSLWRGGTLQLWLVFPYCFNIPTYDFFKSQILRYHERMELANGAAAGSGFGNDAGRFSTTAQQRVHGLTLGEVAVCSGLTKTFLLLLSHPLIMVRTRMQDQRSMMGPIQYARVTQSVRTIVRTQGVLGMYRGFFTALVHTLPRSVLHYIVYENTLNLFLSAQSG